MPATYGCLYVHIVFSTSLRQRSIKSTWRGDLWAYIGGICRRQNAKPLAIGGTDDHIHILADLRPSLRPSDFVRDIKRGSSVWIHSVRQQPHFQWQNGYSAFSVSSSQVMGVKRYIFDQEAHHRQRSSVDEWRALLQNHGLAIREEHFE